MLCEPEGRDWGNVATSGGMPKIVSKSPEARREVCDRFFTKALRSNQPCQHLDIGLLASRTVRQQISDI